jgi:hypothetical protein
MDETAPLTPGFANSTNCPEYELTAVQVSLSNGPSR